MTLSMMTSMMMTSEKMTKSTTMIFQPLIAKTHPTTSILPKIFSPIKWHSMIWDLLDLEWVGWALQWEVP